MKCMANLPNMIWDYIKPLKVRRCPLLPRECLGGDAVDDAVVDNARANTPVQQWASADVSL